MVRIASFWFHVFLCPVFIPLLGLDGVFETRVEIYFCLSIDLFYLSHSNEFVIALKSLKQFYKVQKQTRSFWKSVISGV